MIEDLIRLVKSLSKAEKRQFKMACKKQQRHKAYEFLFDLIDQSDSSEWDLIKQSFKKKFRQSSAESAASHLFKLLTDILVHNKIRNDDSFRLMYGIMKVDVFKQRNLLDQAFTEIQSLSLVAGKVQKLPLRYIVNREELNFYSDAKCEGIDEKKLISKQQAASDLLKDLRNEQEHHSLYEILKHRLHTKAVKGKSLKDNSLNDLVLSELAVVNNKAKHNLESQKLHLLFQSFYFTRIGDYSSALKTFFVLNTLFEKNLGQLPNPPMDYYNMLDGILDTLKTIDHCEEMPYFMEKMGMLNQAGYPDFFCFLVKKTVLLYELYLLTFKKEWEHAVKKINSTPVSIYKEFSLVHDKKQVELVFYSSLAYFKTGNFEKANKFLKQVLLKKTVDFTLVYNRTCRLFNIVLLYEIKDLEYLDYEIRSYKRFLKGKNALLPLEKYIFKIVEHSPGTKAKYKNEVLKKKIQPLKDAAGKTDTESSMNHYFDFIEWAAEKLR
jgi:hypothetical protein